MKRFLRSSLLIPLAGVVVACSDDSVVTAPRLSPDATPLSSEATALPNFKDGFEGASISSFWTTNQQYGTMALSTQQAHSGRKSLMFSSAIAPSTSGPKMELSHDFPVPTRGSFSIWFYDVAPGAQTLYEQISLYNSQRPGILATIGTQDFDANCYMARFDDGAQHGPNANCGVYPQQSTTNVPRTAGWHRLVINVKPNGVVFSIDGTKVYTMPGSYLFDRVIVFVSGPYWRPLTTAFFDDFAFSAS